MAAPPGVLWPPRATGVAALLLLAAAACGEVSATDDAGEGSSADAAPGAIDAAPLPDGAPAERGAFLWQQHLHTSFAQVAVAPGGGAAVAASFTGSFDLGGGVLAAGAQANLLLARFDAQGAHRASTAYGADGDEFVISDELDLEDQDTVAGIFRGAGDAGGGPLGPAEAFNSFVARYDASGANQWVTELTGPGEVFLRGDATNGSGATSSTGHFTPTMSVQGSELTGAGGADVFYLRLGNDGRVATLRGFGGADRDLGMCAVFDGLGRVYLVGVTDGAIDFGNDAAVDSAGGNDLFVVQLTEQGAPSWALAAGGPDPMADLVYCAVAPGGDLVVAGSFQGDLAFPGVDPLTSQGNGDIFVARVAPTGAVRWARRDGGPGDDSPRGVAVGAGGTIAVAGEFAGTASFGGGEHASVGFLDAYVAAYDQDGGFAWSRSGGGAGDDRATDVAVDPDGAVYLALAFHDRIELGGEPLEADGVDFNGALVKYGP